VFLCSKSRRRRVAIAADSVALLVLISLAASWQPWSERQVAQLGTKIVALRPGLSPHDKLTAYVDPSDFSQWVSMYEELTGRALWPANKPFLQRMDDVAGGRLTRWHLLKPPPPSSTGISYHRDGRYSVAEVKEQLESRFAAAGLAPVPRGPACFCLVHVPREAAQRR